jgi:hypothetical protein
MVPRKSDDPKTKYDTYWFSPQNSYKFNSKRRVDRFRECLEQEGGDEAAAYELYSMAKSKKPGNVLAEVDSANTDNKKKRKGEAVAIGMEESAKTSRKKKRQASGADAANASKAREEKNASNAVVAANDHAASANIMEKAKALAAAEAASKKANDVFNEEIFLRNAGTSKNPERAAPSPNDSSWPPKPNAAAAVVETSNKKISPRKTMKRLEYVLMAQEGEGKGEDTSSTNNSISDILIGAGDEHNDMPAVNGYMKFANMCRSEIIKDNPNMNSLEVVCIVYHHDFFLLCIHTEF